MSSSPLLLTPAQQEQAYAILDALHSIDAFQGFGNRAGQTTVLKWVDTAYAIQRFGPPIALRDLERRVGILLAQEQTEPPVQSR